MNRTITLALIALAALLLAGGTALAKTIDCGAAKQCVGTDRDDNITGTLLDDVILAGKGDDLINASGGSDEVRAGGGADHIFDNTISADGDRIFAGKGDDIVQVQEFDQSRDVVDCGPGTDAAVIDEGFDTAVNCEFVNGNKA